MANYINSQLVKQKYGPIKTLGAGCDGTAMLYENRSKPGNVIVVKYPNDHENKASAAKIKRSMQHELAIMKALSSSPYVVQLLGWDDNWKSRGPALFFEYAALGDALSYRHRVVDRLGHVPEHVLWVLLSNIAQALNYLHTNFADPFIHGDIKPDNILVCGYPGHPLEDGDLLHNPIFKLGDFGRSIYASKNTAPTGWNGTWCYAPPQIEKLGPITPAFDIWALGGIVQFYAYGTHPVISTANFQDLLIRENLFKPENVPDGETLAKIERWNRVWPCKVRDLTDVAYSAELNRWYLMCMDPNKVTRITAKDLVTWFVPVAERHVEYLITKWMADHQEDPQQQTGPLDWLV